MIITGTFPERRVTGKVVGVHDGDTATVLDANKTQYKFRFNGIDAPELKMDFGQKAKQHLSDLIFGKEVTVVYNKVDKYGRFVGTIFVGGVNANLEQIRAGLAWHYKKYAGEQSEADRKTYSDAEAKAREAKLGFWSMPNPTAPWDYRTALKAKQEESRQTREYLIGVKGGCYYINSSGKKSYVNKKFCVNTAPKVTELNLVVAPQTGSETTKTKSAESKDAKKTDGRTYIKGSRGGCYYMNGDTKVYVKDKSLCDN
jgi:endonuclease YncB( thermonuclease family)